MQQYVGTADVTSIPAFIFLKTGGFMILIHCLTAKSCLPGSKRDSSIKTGMPGYDYSGNYWHDKNDSIANNSCCRTLYILELLRASRRDQQKYNSRCFERGTMPTQTFQTFILKLSSCWLNSSCMVRESRPSDWPFDVLPRMHRGIWYK